MRSILRYQKKSDAFTEYTLQAQDGMQIDELATLDGWTYVCVPTNFDCPQSEQVAASVEAVALTPELRQRIMQVSPQVRYINSRMQSMIRVKYSAEAEAYYARIMSGAAAGLYDYKPGEQAEVEAYITHVEGARAWGREMREALSL